MTSITVELRDEQMALLQAAAKRLGVAPEDLVRLSLEELLAHPDDSFTRALDFVLRKNAELYRRLA